MQREQQAGRKGQTKPEDLWKAVISTSDQCFSPSWRWPRGPATMAALPVSSMQRSKLRLRRVLQAKRERKRERNKELASVLVQTLIPLLSSDRTILSVQGLERFWETSRITNYWPGSKWMLNPSSWMCLLHPWENTGPFIIIRVFPGLFHFGDRDLAGQGGTTSSPEWGRVLLQIAPNPPGARDSSGYQSWWAWLLKTNHLVLIPKHGYQEIERPPGYCMHPWSSKNQIPGHNTNPWFSNSFEKKISNIHPNPLGSLAGSSMKPGNFFEAFEIPRTSGSLNPMLFFSKYLDLAFLWIQCFFSQLPRPGGSLLSKNFTWNRRVFQT